MVKKVGLFVGRFQPFHVGHLEAIKKVFEEVDELIIIVGSAQYSHELKDPFTTGERITMIRMALNEAGIDPKSYYTIPIPDVEMHSLWTSLIVAYSPHFDIVYSNDPLSRRLFMEAGYEVRPIPFYNRETFSATEVRRRMLEKEDWKELVPKAIAFFIEKIKGVERLCDLAKTDKA